MQQLAVLTETNSLTVFTAANGLDPYLQEIRDEINGFVGDISTEHGRKEIASMAHKVARSKTALDKVGKELVTRLKAQPKLVDAERKRMRGTLDSWRDEVRRPLDEWQAAEDERQKRILLNIDGMAELAESDEINTSDACSAALKSISETVIDDTFAEHKIWAESVKNKSLQRPNERLAFYTQQEEVAKTAAEKAKAGLAAEHKARDERIAKQAKEEAERAAAEKARIEAERAEREKQAAIERENAAKEAAERAEREKIQAQERAKIQAEEAEKAKIAAEKKAKQDAIDAAEKARQDEINRVAEEKRKAEVEAQKRDANRKYMSRILGAAKISLIDKAGLKQMQAMDVVDMIRKGEIDNVIIKY